jgi:hypothetical protein
MFHSQQVEMALSPTAPLRVQSRSPLDLLAVEHPIPFPEWHEPAPTSKFLACPHSETVAE